MENKKGHKSSRERLNELLGRLRSEIAGSQRRPGEFLPSEKAFAAEYGLSNQLVRKGLELLVAEGLIEKIPRVGTKVVGSGTGAGAAAGPIPHAGGDAVVKLGFHTSVTREADIGRLLEQFQREHPHIRVQAVPLARHDFNYIRSYLNAGILDVVMLNYTDFRDMLESGSTELLEPLERNRDIYPFLSDAFVFEGRQLVQPFMFSPLVLCYNREHFEQLGLSEPDSGWRWSDLIEHASKLHVPNERLGFHFDIYSPNRWPLLLLQTGERFERREDGGIRLADTRMMEALRFCRDLKDVIPFLSEGNTTGESELLLAKGKASMIITSYFYLNYFIGEHVPFDISPVPHRGIPLTLLLNIGLGVNRLSAVKESAVKLMEYLTSMQAQLFIRQQTYSLPAHKTAAEYVDDGRKYTPKRFSLFRETIPSFRCFTDLGLTAAELAELNREVKLFWAGLESEMSFVSRVESRNR